MNDHFGDTADMANLVARKIRFTLTIRRLGKAGSELENRFSILAPDADHSMIR
jgi:hypothetical protein